MDDNAFLASVFDCTFPFEQWNHRAHLRVAYLLLRRYGLDGPGGAVERMPPAIRAYNAANNVEDSLHSGYHETLTVAWLRLIGGLMAAHGPLEDHEAFFARHSYLQSKMMLLAYYSRDHIMSAEAKRSFVAPDLAPFPGP